MGYSTDAPKGDKGDTGATGPPGTGTVGPGVAAGGTIHQVLTKTSSTDYATDWETPTAGVSPGTVKTETTYGGTSADGTSSLYSRTDHGHGNPDHELPTGGTLNQVLAKNTTTDYGVTWVTSSAASTTWPAGMFGTGEDGTLTLDGTSTVFGMVPTSSTYRMVKDIFCSTMTINSGVILRPNGFRIFCSVNLNNSGTISCNGTDGSPGTAGAGGAAGTYTDYLSNSSPTTWGAVSAASGGNGSANLTAGLAATGTGYANLPMQQGRFPTALGGAGGGGFDTNGAARAGGIANAGAAITTGVSRGRSLMDAIQNAGVGTTASAVAWGSNFGWSGGGGGASLETGGGGGGGGTPGGSVFIAAPTISNTGTIRANGGNGGAGFATKADCGGGGGSGGTVVLVYNTMSTTGTITSNGGAGGAHSLVTPVTANGSLATLVNSATDAALYTGTSLGGPLATATYIVINTAVAAGTAGTVTSFTGTNCWNVAYTLVTSTLYNGTLNRLSVYRMTPAAGNVAGILTINMSATQIGLQCVAFSPGATALEASMVVQNVVATGASGNAAATLAALSNAANRVVAFTANVNTTANVTPGAGYTESGEVNVAAGAGTTEVESTTVNTANSTAVTWTNTSAAWAAIAIENLELVQYTGVAGSAGGNQTVFQFTP